MTGENHTTRIEIALPSRLELLGVVDKVVEGITEQMEFEDVDRDAIAISVIEASTNAIQHGHKSNPGLTVDLWFEMSDDRLTVLVRDHGTGFTPKLDGEPTPPDLMSTRGRGIFIMRTMMDDVSFDFHDGTLVRLVKYRAAGGGAGGASSD